MIETNQFRGNKDKWQVVLKLRDKSVLINLHNQESMEDYQGEMTEQNIKDDKHFSFILESVEDLFHFLSTSFQEITITPNGTVLIKMEIPIGRLTKQIQLKISTKLKQADESQIVNLKIKKMQREMQQLKLNNNQITILFKQRNDELASMKSELVNITKTLAQKDQVLNSIFAELRELNIWKEQVQKQKDAQNICKKIFESDQLNPHHNRFIRIGNKYRKIEKANWDTLICKHEIQKNNHYKYFIKQIKAGNGGSFMYGVGTAAVRGINRAQDCKDFIGYYQNTGCIYERGVSTKGGRKVKDGEIMGIEIDTKNWKIFWSIEGVKEAEIGLSQDFITKPIYLTVIVYNENSQLQFI